MPDIDLDFPRDIREKLIPLVHERYGAERSALVAAISTYRARGAVRDLGKALGLPPGEVERLARSVDVYEASADAPARMEEALGRLRAALAALARPGRAAARDRGPAPPHLPAPRRDDHLDQAAGRALPGAARGDGGPPDRPVGQGLLRGRRLPEDRPAGAGDAVGGRALRRRDRADARRADRPLAGRRSTTARSGARSSGPRPPASSRSRAAPRCRCCRGPCPRTSTT